MSAGLAKPTIYLPVEIKARELKAKVLLATVAAQHGFRTYLGTKSAINNLIQLKEAKAGIFLYKGGMPAEAIDRFKRKVDFFAVLDEEMGPALRNLDHSYKGRIYPGTETMVDKLFLIGESHLKALQRVRPKLVEKAIVTGWPRVDLWRSEFRHSFSKDIAQIRKKFGNYLLFASDFGINTKKRKDLEKRNLFASQYTGDTLDYLLNEIDDTYVDFNEFVKCIRKYDGDLNFPPVIVRPHPSEDINAWKNALNGLRKTRVIFKGEISPWLYASSGLLHRGCTTAVQAYFSGIPSIYILGGNSEPKIETLTYSLSYIASDYVTTRKLAGELFLGKLGIKPNAVSLSEIHIGEKLACTSIVEELEKFCNESELPFQQSNYVTFLRYIRGRLEEFRAITGIGMGKVHSATMQRKIPGGIHANEIRSIVSDLYLKKEMTIREVSFNAVMIEAPLFQEKR